MFWNTSNIWDDFIIFPLLNNRDCLYGAKSTPNYTSRFGTWKGFIAIDELIQHFGITPQTIQRDLNLLVSSGIIIRHHGRVESSSTTENTSYQSLNILNLTAKESLACELVKTLLNTAALFINIGITTETITHTLFNQKSFNIITNNTRLTNPLFNKKCIRVIITTGEVRLRDSGIIGEATCDFINQL
jgi:DeoR family glycerol-3-phosphate regulon repressor